MCGYMMISVSRVSDSRRVHNQRGRDPLFAPARWRVLGAPASTPGSCQFESARLRPLQCFQRAHIQARVARFIQLLDSGIDGHQVFSDFTERKTEIVV